LTLLQKPALPQDLESGLRFRARSKDLEGASDFVRRIFSLDNASQMEINKYRIGQAIQRFQPRVFDTGATESQSIQTCAMSIS